MSNPKTYYKELISLSTNNYLNQVPEKLCREEKVAKTLEDRTDNLRLKGLSVIQMIETLPLIYKLQDKDGKDLLLITETPFPYYTDCSQHLILWILQRNLYTIRQIRHFIDFCGYKDYIFWENPVERRSVKEIQHFQILIP